MGCFLTDFGLAKSVATGSKLTRTGEALGTPAYMSPEQARGQVSALTPATDLWSLGVVLYEMLASRQPFEGESTAAVIGGVLLRAPARLRTARPDIPRGLERVVAAALAKRPAERYREAGALREDLERLLRGERPRARPPGSRRRRLLATGAALAVLTWAAWLIRPEATAPPSPPPAAASSRAEALARQAIGLRVTAPEEAVRLLGDALAAEPDRHDWRLERGTLLWVLGRTREAHDEWGRIPEDSPQGPSARLSAVLEAVLRPPGGEDISPRPFRTDGGGREARIVRALRAGDARAWAAARSELEGLEGWDAAFARARTENLDPSGDKAASIRWYGEALAEGPPRAWLHAFRGRRCWEAGDLRGAREDFEAGLALLPGSPEILLSLGSVRDEQGDHEGGLRDLNEALARRPEFP
ncbi:MAG: serine/threonine protein kinase, partial [Planctomycetales bacterium]|nr:serine/threonine protein kinase [Planctomycetales bacterium]